MNDTKVEQDDSLVAKMTRQRSKWRLVFGGLSFRLAITFALSLSLTLSGCFERSEGEPYYGKGSTPQTQEFRWSDGGLPQTFDPALAAAPPDTDAVRALFEGLTDYDPQTLAPVPGVAARWESSEDGRVWTFYLRPDARWSNGDIVTAKDFVRSWQRIIAFGSRAPHSRLFENITGTDERVTAADQAGDLPSQSRRESVKTGTPHSLRKDSATTETVTEFGAKAINDNVLRVRLERPDKDFASLVAHPIFRPVHDEREDFSATTLTQPIVSNGPFKLTQVAGDGVILERAGNYWDAKTVSLNRVRFVASTNAENALEKYRAGEVDVVTNAGFEPLALKLLSPYKDFRRATFGALTFYKFNTDHAPFSDIRVREALAIAIDRERISEDDMDGSSEPARTFLPPRTGIDDSSTAEAKDSISHDVARAQKLLAEAGYPNGVGFPVVKLLINRNDQHRQVAESVAAMWRKSLGIETELIVKNWDEYEDTLSNGEYDVVRKGLVMQTMDEEANMRSMFEVGVENSSVEDSALARRESGSSPANTAKERLTDNNVKTVDSTLRQPILTQADALKQFRAMPIYFASSYSLVRPYVNGFDSNLLDAPSLKRVRLDTSWQSPNHNATGWFRIGD